MPQKGNLKVTTEMGLLLVKPTEIIVIPRGILFKVEVEGQSSGWIAEAFNAPF